VYDWYWYVVVTERKVKEKEDDEEKANAGFLFVAQGVCSLGLASSIAMAGKRNPTALPCMYFVPGSSPACRHAGLQEVVRQGRKEGGMWMWPLRSANWAVSTSDSSSQEPQSQTCATTFFRLAGGYLTVVSSNRTE
jgi:hypothetical protein